MQGAANFEEGGGYCNSIRKFYEAAISLTADIKGVVKCSYARQASLDGIPLSRSPQDAYEQYAGMTKGEHNAADGHFATSSHPEVILAYAL